MKVLDEIWKYIGEMLVSNVFPNFGFDHTESDGKWLSASIHNYKNCHFGGNLYYYDMEL